MATSTISSIKKKTVTASFAPPGNGKFTKLGPIVTNIAKDRIHSIIVNSSSTNAGCFLNFITNVGDVYIGVFQTDSIGSSSINAEVTVFYE